MNARRVLSTLLVLAAALVLSRVEPACNANAPLGRPVQTCTDTCKDRASAQCSDGECARGCEFILDRVIEREAENVIACVARTARRCTDVVWADCAVRVGPHADGGPPAPPPPEVFWE